MIKIRIAKKKDINRLIEILQQVLEIHAALRPDIFITGTTKYTPKQLEEMIENNKVLIYVAVNENDYVLGYCFAFVLQQPFINNMHQFDKLYIDDLGVDEKYRHQGIGKMLFEHMKTVGKNLGCYEITLNVWANNQIATKFYESVGLKVKETNMEYIL